jgi:hypothetical protein
MLTTPEHIVPRLRQALRANRIAQDWTQREIHRLMDLKTRQKDHARHLAATLNRVDGLPPAQEVLVDDNILVVPEE